MSTSVDGWRDVRCAICRTIVRRRGTDAIPETVCFGCWSLGFCGHSPTRLWLNVPWGIGGKIVSLKFAALVEAKGDRKVLYLAGDDTRGALSLEEFLAGVRL